MPGPSAAAYVLPPLGDIIGLWLAALLTLAIFSFLYSDNPLYKLAEHIFVGISAAYGVIIIYYESVLGDMVYPLFKPWKLDLAGPSYWTLVPVLLGLLILTRFVRKYDWLSRWPIAFMMGLYSGMAVPLIVQTAILPQLGASLQPLWAVKEHQTLATTAWVSFSNLLLAGGLLCVLSYFYFSLEHKGLLKVTSRTGVWFLMVAFGAGFGNTVMARISLLIGRIEFLRYDWWPTLVPLFRAAVHALTGHG